MDKKIKKGCVVKNINIWFCVFFVALWQEQFIATKSPNH